MHCGTSPERVPRKTTAGAGNAERVPGKTAERVHDVGKSAQGVWDGIMDGLVFRLIRGRDDGLIRGRDARTMSGLVSGKNAVGLVCTAQSMVVGGIGVGEGLGPTQDQLPERRQR